MSERPWYKRYGADFVHGSLGLTLEEKGAYSLCLDLIYDRQGPIPDDARWLAGVCGVSVRKWTSLRAALLKAGKLTAENGFISNSRAEKEIENALKTSRKHVENGAKGGGKRAENEAAAKENKGLAEAGLKHHAPDIPYTRNQSNNAREIPDDLTASFREAWDAYPGQQGKLCGDTTGLGSFRRALDRGELAATIISAARAYAATKPDYPIGFAKWIETGGWKAYAPAKPAGTDWRGEIELFHKFGDWRPDGPKPGEPGCLAPPEILTACGYRPAVSLVDQKSAGRAA